jgi:hypothetical protein
LIERHDERRSWGRCIPQGRDCSGCFLNGAQVAREQDGSTESAMGSAIKQFIRHRGPFIANNQ